ncbi:conserved hypothetical protein [Anaeromyxobacter sp. K]|uniref:Lipoprotein n=2 Tax=Anaeromyxobacteraceae TaxID=1524215 RepID=B8JG34_ANAD2|nr:conserved hypothetical protein [Anaeromyxobacter sp. K]ACL66437.1 conserved hypothetical protein [Anaeromyxobacter dehalogenans 2CP-1]
MMRMAGLLVLGLLAAGCATNGSVKQQIDPLADRITAVEQQQAAMNAKLDAQTAELQALRKDVADSAATSARAQEAVKAAQDAAQRAELAAQKSAKAFELTQVKGKM